MTYYIYNAETDEYIGKLHACLLQALIDDWHDVDDMLARCDFRHDPAKLLMDGDLCRDDIGKYRAAAAKYSCRCLIAARLDSQRQQFFFVFLLHTYSPSIKVSYST